MNALVALLPAVPAGNYPACSPAVAVGAVEQLYGTLDHVSLAENPRTAHLMQASLRKLSQKVVEEAAEVALEALRKRADATIGESADLLYHMVVLWHRLGIRQEDIWAEMRQRARAEGIAEKRPTQSSRPCSGVPVDQALPWSSPKGSRAPDALLANCLASDTETFTQLERG